MVSAEHLLAFTQLMKFGGLFCIPLAAIILLGVMRSAPCPSHQQNLRSSLWSSVVLFACGGALGFMINGLDIIIPAHYHGSTVGVTIAFMGLVYHLLPRLGFAAPAARLSFWQPIIYGGGQLIHIMGLAWSGGYGVQRKTAGLDQGLEHLGEVAGMGLMGLGGLISVIGGFLFLLIAFRSIFLRPAVEGENKGKPS